MKKLTVKITDENGKVVFDSFVEVDSSAHAAAVVRAVSDKLDEFCEEE